MKLKSQFLSICLLSICAFYSFNLPGQEDPETQSETDTQEIQSADSDFGSFDFGEEFSDIEQPSESKNRLKVSGELETECAISQKNGDLSRGYVKADVQFAYKDGGTEIVALFRGETDTLRDRTYSFDNMDALDQTRRLMEDNTYNADAIAAAGNANNTITESNSTNSRVYLREAYINQGFSTASPFLESINLKMGKIIYTWGNADDVKPVDILNHQDLSRSVIKPLQERKYAVLSTDTTFYFTDSIFLESVFMPCFEAHETASTRFKDSSLESEYIVDASVLPDNSPENFSYAHRIGFSVYDIDMHLNHFFGPDKSPTLTPYMSTHGVMIDQTQLATALATGGDPMSAIVVPEAYYLQTYNRIQMIGFDYQRALFSGIATRGEIAYYYQGKRFYTEEDIKVYIDGVEASDEQLAQLLLQAQAAGLDTSSLTETTAMPAPVEKDVLAYNIGFDDMDLFGIDDLYANLALYQKLIIDYDDSITDDQLTTWIIAKLEYSMLRDKLKATSKTIWDTGGSSIALTLEPSYKVSEMCKLTAGTAQVFGEKDNDIGQYKDDDYYYLNAKATF